jgi:hypothetical protein
MIRSASFRGALAALTASLALGFCTGTDPGVQGLLTPTGANDAKTCPDASCGAPPPPACGDGIRNGDETDVDCGGLQCTTLGKRCADGAGCRVAGDCESSSCQGSKCQPPSCADGVRNGIELDVDCGAACGSDHLCPVGKKCGSNSDCTTGICNGTMCIAPSCSDGLKNQDETDVDCGGKVCERRCAFTPAQSCRGGTDCISGVCDPLALVCAAPSCDDGVLNGAETDLDCGGNCAPKRPCPPTQRCRVGTDCDNLVCEQGLCAAATCSDGVQNGKESDVDCGGPCSKCGKGRKCSVDADCDSDFCHLKSAACIELWSPLVTSYAIGSQVGYQHVLYVALQDIPTNNATWVPPAVPALWQALP